MNGQVAEGEGASIDIRDSFTYADGGRALEDGGRVLKGEGGQATVWVAPTTKLEELRRRVLGRKRLRPLG